MLRLDKRHKYLILSALSVLFVFFFMQSFDLKFAFAAVLTALLGSFAVNLPYSKPRHFLINNLMPLHLVVGSLLSLYFFPNLGLPVKIVYLIFLFVGMYIVSLINNIFLVVEEKGELIPLYRVAVTWSQIVFVLVAIPFFAGVFKVPVVSVFQNIAVAFSAFVFTYYSHWMLSFDPEIKKVRGVEALLWSLLSVFIVFTAASSVSFFPTEAFLRALFCASVLMFSLNYFYSYLKNSINRRSLTENFIVTVVFFVILFVFKP